MIREDTMSKFFAALTLTAALLATAGTVSSADAATCAMIRGSGIGATDGIARWMANKAVTDSAAKWAGTSKHTLAPVKLTCSGFSCSGAAKACKK